MCNVSSIEEPLLSSCENGVPVNYSQECNFSCQTGYDLMGPSSVNCTSFGNFSEPFPECPVVMCNVSSIEEPLLSSCENGVPVNYSQECNFSCQTGYDLMGPSSVNCTSFGNFSEPFPECPIVMCNVSSIEEPLLSSCGNGVQVNYSQECNFSCQIGYELIGPSSVNCTRSGNFSEPFPECPSK
nr:E-selectin-like [Lytechinus pictus]